MRHRHVVTASLGILIVGLSFLPAALGAQGTLREQTAGKAARPQQIIAVNPFLPLFGYFQAEFERKLKDNLSVALGGSVAPWNNDYANLDAKLRLYPQDRALEGLGFSAGLGMARAKKDNTYDVCTPQPSCTPVERTGQWTTAPTVSIETQYQWLMGRSRSTAVTVGGGAKRYFFSDDAAVGGLMRVLPTARLTIGWGF